MDVLSNVLELSNAMDNMLDSEMQLTSTNAGGEPSAAVVNLNGNYMFNDEESMDMLLNNIGLAVQRKEGR